MHKGKSDKEISLQILDTYYHFFKIKNTHINNNDENEITMINQKQSRAPDSDSDSNANQKKMLNDVLEKDFLTEKIIKQINDEFIDQSKETKSNCIPQVPLLIPKDISSSYKHAFDICELINHYDSNQNTIQKEFEIFIMKLERSSYKQLLPTVISKIIDRVVKINIHDSFSEFIGPSIIGSYSNNHHFFTDTIDMLLYCSNFTEISKLNSTLLQNVITFLLKRLLLEASERVIIKSAFIKNTFKAVVKIKSSNIKICIYFVAENNKEYEDTLKNIRLISRRDDTYNERSILCKMLRLWRRRWNLTNILPEIIDYLAEYHYTYSISEGFVKVLYILYTMKIHADYHFWIKQQLSKYNEDNELKNKIAEACNSTSELLTKNKFEKIFVL